LAAINEHFCLGTNGHKIYRDRENQTVGMKDSIKYLPIIVLDYAHTIGVAAIALSTRTDIKITQADVFSDCTRRLGTRQRLKK
jgi:hypothetical protein